MLKIVLRLARDHAPVQPGESHRLGRLTEVLAFIWKFDPVNRPRIEAVSAFHGPNVPVCRLSGARDIAAFLSSYGDGADYSISI